MRGAASTPPVAQNPAARGPKNAPMQPPQPGIGNFEANQPNVPMGGNNPGQGNVGYSSYYGMNVPGTQGINEPPGGTQSMNAAPSGGQERPLNMGTLPAGGPDQAQITGNIKPMMIPADPAAVDAGRTAASQEPTTAPPPGYQPAATQGPAGLASIAQNRQFTSGSGPGKAFDQSNAALWGTGNTGRSVADMMTQAQDAAYNRQAGYLDPQWSNQENQLRNTLANQGVMQNSEAWNRAMDDFARQKAFAYADARNNAYGQGMSAQNQVANQLLQNRGIDMQGSVASMGARASMSNAALAAETARQQLQEQMRQNSFGNNLAMRNQDLNEILMSQQNPLMVANQLQNGYQVQQPNFPNVPGASIQPTDYAGIVNNAYNQNLNAYNTQVGAGNSAWSGLFGIGSAMLGAPSSSVFGSWLSSDRRLKTNIKQIGMHKVGVPLYSYTYSTGEQGFGVLADELEKVRPDAVATDENGFKMVNYGAISDGE